MGKIRYIKKRKLSKADIEWIREFDSLFERHANEKNR